MQEGINLYTKYLGWKAIAHRIQSKILRSVIVHKQANKKLKFPVYFRIPSSDVSTYQQIFIENAYMFDLEMQPTVIVDAGANIGLASIFFANKYPDAKIISIEPEETNFELLKRNTAPYKQITCIQAALWSQDGEIDLVDPGLGNWGFMTEEKNSDEKSHGIRLQATKAVTIDWVIKEYCLDEISILKIDIEGAEREVFQHASSWINKVHTMIAELHERLKPGCNSSFEAIAIDFETKQIFGDNILLSRELISKPFPIR